MRHALVLLDARIGVGQRRLDELHALVLVLDAVGHQGLEQRELALQTLLAQFSHAGQRMASLQQLEQFVEQS